MTGVFVKYLHIICPEHTIITGEWSLNSVSWLRMTGEHCWCSQMAVIGSTCLFRSVTLTTVSGSEFK